MADEAFPTGKELEKKLHKGKLPQMVDWFDPLVLGMVAIRTLISTTIGKYADQRPMQQAMDGETGDLLTRRHDYSNPPDMQQFVFAPEGDESNPRHRKDRQDRPRQLRLDETGAMWVDFIADLGDGFEATYAMAYLLAAHELKVRGTDKPLPAGQILIFGGDLAYPNATIEEYRARCLDPYSWAFTADRNMSNPRRELFFVAGNHDWYDGLSAFTHQFCYESEAIGGWRCTQQRSYFAIKLPYDWWIWGIDVGLSDSIDAAQLEYFQAIVKEMDKKEANPKIVIILHAPDWTKPPYRALARICEAARKEGEICAILAGDLHHYARYESFKPKDGAPERHPPLNLIVAGGGGAFAHPTHDQKKRLVVDSMVAGRGLIDKGEGLEEKFVANKEPDYHFKAIKFYPSRIRSRILALKNLWLPFHNRRFAVLVGCIYFFYAWVFGTSVPEGFAPPPSESIFDLHIANAAAVAATAQSNPTFFFMLLGLWVGLIFYVDAKLQHRLWKWLNGPIKVVFGTLHFQLHIMALLFVSAVTTVLTFTLLNPIIGVAILHLKLFLADAWQGTLFASEGNLKAMHDCASNFDWSGAAAETWRCVSEQLGKDALYIGATALTQAATSILIGGMIGAFIFGFYWVVTSVLFGMHQDAFSALAVPDYKNFLRMKFEKDKLTIYPIALDRVPRRKEWRANPKTDGGVDDPMPLLVPKRDMRPRLIHDPIAIKKEARPDVLKAFVPGGGRNLGGM